MLMAAVYHRDMETIECADTETEGRILAIDFGTVRMGLAISDALGLTAQGLATLVRTNKEEDFRYLGTLAAEYAVARVIVGHPISAAGEETEMSRRVVRFAEELHERLALPVDLWDERMTSLEADRSLRESNMGGRKRRQARDRVAAQILLQSYLDRRAYQRQETGA
ncbi:MAG TPA: Holliday junction resolvase RuvX [Terriglobia bacterium]|nr:Holliday junction resolvase RuvX [Terriglobia bacterium]